MYSSLFRIVFISSLFVTCSFRSQIIDDSGVKKIKIAGDFWMSRNLNVQVFRNGDSIPEAKTNEEWINAGKNQQPAWCYYNNDSGNGGEYGKLYNWYAVNDPRGLAPLGWHIPTVDDWNRLIDSLGGYDSAVISYFNKNKSKDSEFNSVTLGGRYPKKFGSHDRSVIWWSSEQFNKKFANAQVIDFHKEQTVMAISDKSFGFPVRCIWNFQDYEIDYNELFKLSKKEYPSHIDSLEKITYSVNKIGNQVWMCGNLNKSFFNNGDSIYEARNLEDWNKSLELKRPAWCYYDFDPLNREKLGKLYNWYSIIDPRGLAPDGWHIPTENDWDTLNEFLLEFPEAVLLKSKIGWEEVRRVEICDKCIALEYKSKRKCAICGGDGFVGKKIIEANGIDFFGFNAIPSGEMEFYANGKVFFNGVRRELRWYDGFYNEQLASYWAMPNYDNLRPICYHIDGRYGISNIRLSEESCGMSVRCVKN